MELNDPAFPHGEDRGYRHGCRKPNAANCPGVISCNDAHNASKRAAYHAHDPKTVGQAKTSHVLRRLTQTIDAVGIDKVATTAGLTVGTIRRRQAITTTTMSWEQAAPLDRSWALLVHGVDVTAPGFPHGTNNGYVKYCRCEDCCAASSRSAARRVAGIKSPLSLLTDDASRARLAAHVAKLLEHGTSFRVARAASLSRVVVEAARKQETVTLTSFHKLMRTTPADVHAARRPDGWEDPTRTVHRMRTLWALGYPLTWQAKEVGLGPKNVNKVGRPGKMVKVRTAVAVEELAARIGDTLATPENTGLAQRELNAARSRARAAGWYPPVCYDDQLQLIPTAIPGHPWALLEERAAHAVHACYLAGTGLSAGAAAAVVGVASSSVERDVKNWWGYTYVASQKKNPARHSGVIDQVASRARFCEVAEVFHQMEAGELGPVTAALTLGKTFGNLPKDQRDHPEILAWRADIPAADAA